MCSTKPLNEKGFLTDNTVSQPSVIKSELDSTVNSTNSKNTVHITTETHAIYPDAIHPETTETEKEKVELNDSEFLKQHKLLLTTMYEIEYLETINFYWDGSRRTSIRDFCRIPSTELMKYITEFKKTKRGTLKKNIVLTTKNIESQYEPLNSLIRFKFIYDRLVPIISNLHNYMKDTLNLDVSHGKNYKTNMNISITRLYNSEDLHSRIFQEEKYMKDKVDQETEKAILKYTFSIDKELFVKLMRDFIKYKTSIILLYSHVNILYDFAKSFIIGYELIGSDYNKINKDTYDKLANTLLKELMKSEISFSPKRGVFFKLQDGFMRLDLKKYQTGFEFEDYDTRYKKEYESESILTSSKKGGLGRGMNRSHKMIRKRFINRNSSRNTRSNIAVARIRKRNLLNKPLGRKI